MQLESDHRVIIFGTKPGVAAVLETGMCVHSTLVGYIEQHCLALLAVSQIEMQEKGEIPEAMRELLYDLRDQYNEALGDGDGDMELFARFKLVLGEVPRKEVCGRPFPRSERVKGAETSRGGSTFIARKQ
ncbi:MAG: hypothetical protein ABIG34_00280 [Candidatus Peregrinibacteria bacterium]